jgi:hypothetical protein
MKQYKTIAFIALAGLASAAWLPAQDKGWTWEFFGSQVIEASMAISGDLESGFLTTTRLGLEYTSETGPGFRTEGHIAWAFGFASMEAVAFDAGLAIAPAPSALPLGMDLHRAAAIDQAYAKISLGLLDGQLGLIPVAWGSAYLFNPSARTTAPSFPGTESDTVAGKPGIHLFLTPAYGFSLEAYALAQGRLPSAVPDLDETDYGKFPFGIKAAVRTEAVDVSISFSRSLMDASSMPEYRIGADATGFVGPLTLYAEAAALVLAKEGDTFRAFEAWNDIDACAGISWLAPIVDLTLRAEFAWLGEGTDDSAEYSFADLLSGTKATLGKAYGFAMLEKELDDRFKASAGGLWNMYDASCAFLARFIWSPMVSLELGLFAVFFSGDSKSEFGSTMQTGPDTVWDPYIPRCALSIKAFF